MNDSNYSPTTILLDRPDQNLQANIKIRIADTPKLKKEAYHLIYDKYLEKGYAKESTQKMWFSKYDLLEETTTFVAMDNDEVVGAVTLIFDSKLGLPAENLYKKEIAKMKRNNNLAETTSLGVKKGTRYSLIICVKLLNQIFLYAKGIKNISHFIVTINPRHTRFYLKKFLFDKLGEVKYYDKVGGAPAELLILDLEMTEKRLVERLPVHNKTLLVYCKSIKECHSEEEFRSSQSGRWIRQQ